MNLDTPTLIVLAMLGAALAWQLVTGRTPGRGANALRRRDHPVSYWVIVGIQGAFLAFVAATGNASPSSAWCQVVTGYREYRVGRAVDLREGQQWARALAEYDELLPVLPGDVRIAHGRGMALRHLDREAEALAEFRRAVALDPTHYPSYVGIDRILSGRERWDELLALWGGYLARFPANAQAWYERGVTHWRKGDRAAARADAQRACDLGLAEACQRVAKLDAGK